jgi:hypothetical protein
LKWKSDLPPNRFPLQIKSQGIEYIQLSEREEENDGECIFSIGIKTYDYHSIEESFALK